MKNFRPLIYTLLWLCSAMNANSLHAQCAPDTTPPVAICEGMITYTANAGNGITVYLEDLNSGSYDDCTDTADLIITLSPSNDPNIPGASFYFAPGTASGFYTFELTVTDESGNTSTCVSVVELIITGSNCDPDNDAPVAICEGTINAVVSPTIGLGYTLYIDDLDDGSYDLCTSNANLIVNMFSSTSPGNPIDSFFFAPNTAPSSYFFELHVIDEVGNTSVCDVEVAIEVAGGNCDPDATPPVAVCDAIFISTDITGPVMVSVDDIDDGSWDNCTDQVNLGLFMTTDITSSNIPTATSITYPPGFNGTDTVALWVVDESGNANFCVTVVSISNCPPPFPFPTITCINEYQVPFDPNGYTINAIDILEFPNDSCLIAHNNYYISENPNFPALLGSISFPPSTSGSIPVYVMAIDMNGNTAVCWTTLIFQDPQACINDTIPPTAICNANNVITLAIDDFVLYPEYIDDGSYDNCTIDSNLEFYVTLDGSLTAPPTTDSLIIPAGTNGSINVYLWVVDEAGNYSVCVSDILFEYYYYIYGMVFQDLNSNCLLDSVEQDLGLGNYPMRYTIDDGATYTTIVSDINGGLPVIIPAFPGIGDATFELILPPGQSSACQTTYTVDLSTTTSLVKLDFPTQLSNDCDNMTVDIGTNALRRCLPSTYWVSYCNNSAFDIDSVELLVTLPTSMVVQSVGQPYTNLGNGQLFFDIGTVASGSCAQFPIEVVLDCNTPLGATKCVQAEITPHTCDDPMQLFNGADLVVAAVCDDNEEKVRFTITNEGNEAMIQSREYIVIEDVIMYMQNPIQLGPGQSETVEFPANGSTWRLEIEQDPGHPSLSNPSATIEGCIEYGSMGYVNQFATPDADPYLAIDCQEVIGSFDPNDKRAFPQGYAEEHYIKANTSIEYNIRFQNTGTDTAFTVRIEDRLSPMLDFSTLEAGAASHPYRLEVQEGGLLIFHFENILLPDSTINEPASHGFVQFRIDQIADNPLGSVIENTADIYFDFNEAIQTNTTFHTIGDDFIISGVTQIFTPNLDVTIAPNPLTSQAVFTLDGLTIEKGQFELYDVYGRLVKQDKFTDQQYQFSRDQLPSGTYVFRFLNQNKLIANGKLVIL